jgi:hypothetical protein
VTYPVVTDRVGVRASALVLALAVVLQRPEQGPSMRATFITTALENGAQLEDVQKAAGHRDPREHQALRSMRLQPRKGGELLCPVLNPQLLNELASAYCI